jgi:hypothetical protein
VRCWAAMTLASARLRHVRAVARSKGGGFYETNPLSLYISITERSNRQRNNQVRGCERLAPCFFSITTGLHVTQGTCGVIAFIVVGMRYKGRGYNADDTRFLGLYWHFVDLVWMFVVPHV